MKKYKIVYEKYKKDILEGFLLNHQALPSIRESCQLLKVSQTTVEHAYNKLVMEGYITNKPQIGYFVDIDEERIQLHKQIDQYQIHHEVLSYTYDFRSQTVSQDSFEMKVWKRYLKDVLDNMANMSTYGDSQGEYVLREALCQYAYNVRGVLCHPDQILIGSNYQSLLFILCGLFEKGTIIGMEYQKNSQAKRVFESYGYQIEMIKMNNDGIDMNDLRKHDIDVLYINSASQGLKRKPISHQLKNDLLSYTQEKNIFIIEDDYNGELTYASKDRYALQGFSHNDNVIYCGSFSRLLLPSLRISYLVFNKHYYQIYQQLKKQYGPTASKLEQLAFAQYIVDGYLQKHLKKLKKEYREKNKYMLNALQTYIPYPYYLDEAYLCYHILLDNINENQLMQECQKQHIAINSIHHHILSISFASLQLSEIENAIILLSQIIKKSSR